MPLFVLLAMLGAAPVVEIGDLWVRSEPGARVLIDGVLMGVTIDEDAGLKIYNLRAGQHEVVVQLEGGAPAKFTVDIAAKQMSQLEVTPLALREHLRRPKAAATIRVAGAAAPCSATVGSQQFDMTNTVIATFDSVPSGRQRVVITCADQTVSGDADLAAGRLTAVDVNFKTRRIRTEDIRPRVTEIRIKSATEIIDNSRLPGEWRRALATAWFPTIKVTSVEPNGYSAANVSFEAPTFNEAAQFIQNVYNQTSVLGIAEMKFGKYTSPAIVQITVTFR